MAASGKITVDPIEITDMYKQLMAIMEDLQSNAVPAIENIKNTKFYQEGKAMEAIEAYPEANDKFMELQDHYARISSLVIETLNTMIETDEAIALKIIDALEV
ncbi:MULTISPECIES: hypothetical protein [Terribacillus]|jgi:hypothetical protein|uniref:Uncharacterized protein n=1 Tax=Terribacillus saccharophilus TaxID=361277 RepID=A0ABX4GUQ5_9BACI|nr:MULTISPECIES: hypothetical protein [Terribacillus]PAD34269.1 hypothetical protein CHH56_15315 [Terribacillus saccharophilus]PAD94847.1 hypothetical protein CHH50_16405 [Terribacillus saccharophilus]PAD98596.1 hypothetical protein CHH48_16415 [Terribacillus saccharophilus]